jgi:hypothetical protein
MQYTVCHLRWTMTGHRIADVAAQNAVAATGWAERRRIAEISAWWAKAVDDTRGRRRHRPH